MTEKTQKSKVVVLVKHMHTHTHPHTRLLDFSGYPPLFGGLTVSTYISAVTLLTAQPGRTHASAAGGFRTPDQSFRKLVPEPLFQNHFQKLVSEKPEPNFFWQVPKT